MSNMTNLYMFLNESDPEVAQDLVPFKLVPKSGKKMLTLLRRFLTDQADLIREMIQEVLKSKKLTKVQKEEFKRFYGIISGRI